MSNYKPEDALIKLNGLIGQLYELYNSIPGLNGVNDSTRAELDAALHAVRQTVAHAIALGLAQTNERPR
jgi:uncharacterized protein Usg